MFKQPILIITACILVFGISNEVQAQTPSISNARGQAITHLGQLVQTYDVRLSGAEQLEVQSICRDLQSSTIQSLSSDIKPLKDKYLKTSQRIDSTIKFTANSMHQMSEDSSNLDLAGAHLVGYVDNFTQNIDVYERSLDEILIIDCQLFPDLFVAGLEEARFRRELVLSAAEDIVDFIDVELKNAFGSSLERLKEIEGKS